MTFNHCSERNDRAFEWFSESSLTRSSSIRREILCTITADVPSCLLRTALPFQQFHSFGIDEVQKYDDSVIGSSQDLPNSNELSV